MNNINQKYLGGSDEDYCKKLSTEIEENKSDIRGLFQVSKNTSAVKCKPNTGFTQRP